MLKLNVRTEEKLVNCLASTVTQFKHVSSSAKIVSVKFDSEAADKATCLTNFIWNSIGYLVRNIW